MGQKYSSDSALELKTNVDLSELFNNNLICIESKTMRKPKMLFYLSIVVGQFYFS